MTARRLAAPRRAAALAALFVTIAGAPAHRLAAQDITVAPVVVVDRKAVFGTVESVKVAPARARIGGTIDQITVVEGDRVEDGQLVARVIDPKLRLELAALDAKIGSLRSQQELAQTEFARARELRASGVVPQARLDAAQTNFEVLTGSLASAVAERAVLVQQQAEGDVLSPTAGRVLKVRAIAGTVVMPGETIAEIATETYVLRISIPERHARFIRPGDGVLVGERGLAADGAQRREGRIRQVYPEMQAGRVVADVEVSGLGDYFVGERTRVYVAAGSRETFIVPPDYLRRRFGLSFVRLKDGGEVMVQPGLPVDGGVEILSGLRPGDVLVKP